MTVAELKNLLSSFPDTMEVTVEKYVGEHLFYKKPVQLLPISVGQIKDNSLTYKPKGQKVVVVLR